MSSPFTWSDTLGALQRGNSVLFLGPLSYRTRADQSLRDQLYEQLQVNVQPHPHIRNFFPDDGFLLFRDGPARHKFVLKLREGYQAEKDKKEDSYLFRPDAMLRQIARIPFRMIVNLSHHDLLQAAFDLEGLPYKYDFYHRSVAYRPFGEPTMEKPLIYNMLGDLNEQSSLVLTHKDLFDFLKSVFEGKSMAPEMKGLLNEMEHFIFLGMPFEKWYLQLLLQVLTYITDKAEVLERFASHPDQQVMEKVNQQFNIHFIPDNPNAEAFISDLFAQCGDLLKGGGAAAPADRQTMREEIDRVKQFFMQGKYQQALNLFWPLLEAGGDQLGELKTEIMFRQGEYNRLNGLVVGGMANDTDRADLAKVIYGLIEGVGKVEKALTA